jgi:hypothetical protein
MEHIGNREKTKEIPSLSPLPPKIQNKKTKPPLSLFIKYMKFLFPKQFVTIFNITRQNCQKNIKNPLKRIIHILFFGSLIFSIVVFHIITHNEMKITCVILLSECKPQ